MLDPLLSHTKEFKHDITAAALSLGDPHNVRDWLPTCDCGTT